MTKGFTIIELVVTLAFVGVLFSIGFVLVPRGGFAVAQASETLARDFQLARFEAISRNVCAGLVIDGATDTYLIFADADADCSYDAGGDLVIKTVDPGTTYGVEIASASHTPFVFDTRGIPASPTGAPAVHFVSNDRERFLCVSLAGRPQIQEGSC